MNNSKRQQFWNEALLDDPQRELADLRDRRATVLAEAGTSRRRNWYWPTAGAVAVAAAILIVVTLAMQADKQPPGEGPQFVTAPLIHLAVGRIYIQSSDREQPKMGRAGSSDRQGGPNLGSGGSEYGSEGGGIIQGPAELKGTLLRLVAVEPSRIDVATDKGQIQLRWSGTVDVHLERKERKMNGTRIFAAVLTATVLTGVADLSNPLGAVHLGPGAVGTASADEAPTAAVKGLTEMFGDRYKPADYKVTPKVPAYGLPLDTSKVLNYAYVAGKMPVGKYAKLLKKNGFVATPFGDYPKYQQFDGFTEAYEFLRKLEVPVFVTSDSMLHVYHVQFDETLLDIEKRVFVADLSVMLSTLQKDLLAKYGAASGEWKDATGLALGAVTVARRTLSDTSATIAVLKPLRDAIAKENWSGRRGRNRASQLLRKHIGAIKLLEAYWRKQLGGKPKPYFRDREKGRKAIIKVLDQCMSELEKKTDEKIALPAELEAKVVAELALIAKHEGPSESPLFTYGEDYSQYVPRGHYTRHESLKRYFKSMMYLGRLTFLIRGKQDKGATGSEILDTAVARVQTKAAALLTKLINTTKADKRTVAEIWQRMYTVTAYYVGLADDLTSNEYRHALTAAVGKSMDLAKLDDEKTFLAFKWELAKLRKPAIYSGTGDVVVWDADAMAGIPDEAALTKILANTQGFRVMGQRFVPDSYLMGKLVSPTVGAWEGGAFAFTTGQTAAGPRRVFARGIDVYNVFGSHRAAPAIKRVGDNEYFGFAEATKKLQNQFAALTPADWNRNLYWSWIYATKGLLEKYGKGYQSFQQTDAWGDRQLHTACASWSQLRHDTILYVKQPYGPSIGMPRQPKDVPGYVEPAPEFFARLLALSRMTRQGLSDLKVLDDPAVKRLVAFEKICDTLLTISVKELENKVLTKNEYDFIKYFGYRLKSAVTNVDTEGIKTTIVADVMTDSNSGYCLEEATGKIDWTYVVYSLPDGTLGIGVGPTLSYFEFKQPMSDRLTDEQWRAMLKANPHQNRPNWTNTFIAPSAAK